MASQNIKLSFTGHIDVLDEDKNIFQARLRSELEKLRKENDAHITLYNAMAAGADQWAAECLKEGDQLIIIHGDADETKRDFSHLTLIQNVSSENLNFTDINQKYTQIRDFLISNCTHLIAAWDGIYNYKEGGTSDVVFSLINEAEQKIDFPYFVSDLVHKVIDLNYQIQVFQFITPRKSNPYPVAAFIDEIISFEDQKYNRFPFALHYSMLKMTLPKVKQQVTRKKTWVKDSNFWTYTLIIILVPFTLFLGTIGFYNAYLNSGEDFFNPFFRAINLITFNNSVLEIGKENLWLNVARLMALFILPLGFFYGFYVAFKRQRDDFKFWWWRKWKNYHVVFGLNEKSYDLIIDLQKSNEKNVLIIDPDCKEEYKSALESFSNIIFRKRAITSNYQVRRAYLECCKSTFIFSDNESDVIRCVQEIDSVKIDIDQLPNIYVQIKSESGRRFIHDCTNNGFSGKLSSFDIHDNTVRRLLTYYPIDRFYQNPSAKETDIFILGEGDLSSKFIDYIMRIGHFGENHNVNIKVICKDAQRLEKEFDELHPLARPITKPDTNLHRVTNYTWEYTRLEFIEHPKTAYDFIIEKGLLVPSIKRNKIVSIYALYPDGVESAKLLNEILPRLDHLKTKHSCNLQVFCYYNFPDKNEEIAIERLFNKLAPNTFVKLFGNWLDECTYKSIQNVSLDELPKLINAIYYDDKKILPKERSIIEKNWINLKDEKKISNRMAADHMWAKLRHVWPIIGWDNVDMDTMIPKNYTILIEKGYDEILGKLEHKRWCADLLMQNTIPYEYDAKNKKVREEYSEKWNVEKSAFKKEIMDQRHHIDLVPYDLLHDTEKKKDKDQVENIPKFLHAIIKK